ncbi:hypothetical protein IFR04_014076 [Cadophora malorum]|uniref:Uncharacterized protein n=1 Tax=Cadophora malorum TaxID=108018 RepID=A0A8H7T1D2_9HELO|nr:hypothetical protein IFR04_014076 [Cadophora malorum]
MSARLPQSASSGRPGWCQVCSHQNNEHNFYQCEAWVGGGRKKKGGSKATRCPNEFSICQSPAHDGYTVCGKCHDHPGGGPGGSEPGGWMKSPDQDDNGGGSSGEYWTWDPKINKYKHKESDGSYTYTDPA